MIDDVISLCTNLIKCKSITPANDGAIECIADYLANAGFETKILTFESPDGKNSIKNLFARYGKSEKRILGFLGHSDVVPAGDHWEVSPFEGVLKDGYLYGRGTCDMKGGIAAFCAAVTDFVSNKDAKDLKGSIEILITGDEEVGSREGIQSLIDWCQEHRHLPHDCLIGEPSSHKNIGDRVYIGHRGSLNVLATSHGRQGHVAYHGNYDNSLSKICSFVTKMMEYQWKHEDKRFPKTNLEPTMLFTNNHATNVVPEKSSVNINIRYGDDYKCHDLEKICQHIADEFALSLKFDASGDAYCCDDSKLKTMISNAIHDVTGITPEFSCGGGTSDGRYMIKHCNVIEFGLQDGNIHQKNERAKVDDLMTLAEIYRHFLDRYFE